MVVYLQRKLRKLYSYLWYRIRVDPIFILGNQKSGTSVMVELLGKAAGASYQNDIRELYEPIQSKLHNGEIHLSDFIRHHARSTFSKRIIKEPALTFLFADLYNLYPEAKYLFICRDPRNNIRSILNRVELPGNLAHLDTAYLNLSPEWIKIIDNRWLGVKTDHYVESLAGRWNLVTSVYLSNMDKFKLVRYEDFIVNKIKTVEDLLKDFNVPYTKSINDFIDIPYQPQGDNSKSWEDYFGPENLARINSICATNMFALGYTSK